MHVHILGTVVSRYTCSSQGVLLIPQPVLPTTSSSTSPSSLLPNHHHHHPHLNPTQPSQATTTAHHAHPRIPHRPPLPSRAPHASVLPPPLLIHKLTLSTGLFLFHPTIANYPHARFPGICLFGEIYQVTGPVMRFARQIASHGYIVAAPSSYHDFVGPDPLRYDAADTDRGNAFKTLESYDDDIRATVDHLSLPTCTGLIGSTGMCLGGHLALRAALDPRITACVSYFAKDVHARTLGPHAAPDTSATGPPGSAHTLDRLHELNGAEVAMIFGVKDTHVPAAGRDLIRAKLRDAGVPCSFYEFAWAQHAFIRDELSKGRYYPAITKVCFEILLELFNRTLKTQLGPPEGEPAPLEHVC